MSASQLERLDRVLKDLDATTQRQQEIQDEIITKTLALKASLRLIDEAVSTNVQETPVPKLEQGVTPPSDQQRLWTARAHQYESHNLEVVATRPDTRYQISWSVLQSQLLSTTSQFLLKDYLNTISTNSQPNEVYFSWKDLLPPHVLDMFDYTTTWTSNAIYSGCFYVPDIISVLKSRQFDRATGTGTSAKLEIHITDQVDLPKLETRYNKSDIIYEKLVKSALM